MNNNSKNPLKIYIAQINFIVGDLDENYNKIIAEYNKALDLNSDLIIFSEMSICGYPCEDLWLKDYFIEACKVKIIQLMNYSKNKSCAIIIGSPTFGEERKKLVLRNSALLIENGELIRIINKKSLPNYGVFDENRYFSANPNLSIVEFRGYDLAIMICEDFWDERNLFLLKEQVLDCVIIINASPFAINKHQQRLLLANKYSQQINKPLIYINQVGAQDSLVFDGSSFIFNDQKIFLQLANFNEDSAQITLENNKITKLNFHEKQSLKFEENEIAQIYFALILGLRDYVKKNNFDKILIGMSGGIDSALVATIAVDALGEDCVKLVALPTKFNAISSFEDANLCAKNLNLNLEVIEIEDIFQNFVKVIKHNHQISEIAHENLQSRIRGNILMALANSYNMLLISTGNKSELACGYATLYGDMNGAFNPLKDIYKTQIYQLANYRNINVPNISNFSKLNLIPDAILNKEPSAELRYDQKDSDSLPPYAILDKILYAFIEEKKSIDETIKMGFDRDVVKKIAKVFYANEYKRKQSVIGCKVSINSFDKDRRYPITNKFTL
jgi:NAD+ synthase